MTGGKLGSTSRLIQMFLKDTLRAWTTKAKRVSCLQMKLRFIELHFELQQEVSELE